MKLAEVEEMEWQVTFPCPEKIRTEIESISLSLSLASSIFDHLLGAVNAHSLLFKDKNRH